MGDCLRAGKLSHYVRNQPPRPTQPGHPSVGRRNEYWRWLRPPLWKKNGEFCVAVAPATRTAGILTQLVKGAGCQLSRPSGRFGSYTGLIGFNPRRLKALKGDELTRNGYSAGAAEGKEKWGSNTDPWRARSASL